LELTVNWLYKYDNSLELPYQDSLSSLIHEPTFKNLVGEAIFNKTRVIIKLGNLAVHSTRPISVNDAINAVRELFHVAYWLAHTYGRSSKPNAGLTFNSDALLKTAPVHKQTIKQLQKLPTQLSDRDEKLSTFLADKNALDEELKQLRAEVATAQKASTTQPDTHDYSEAQTRDIFIDLLLKEAGWALDKKCDRRLPNRTWRNGCSNPL
jgi:type I restriction enzyme, R subunit